MKIMNIQAEKLELIRMVLNTKKPSVLASIRRIFEKEENVDFWDTLSEEEKKEIEEGIAEADRGELIPHEEMMKEVRAKYKLD